MLYISRFVGTNKIGVVDSEDGTEQIITYKDLDHYVLTLGLNIAGVTVGEVICKKLPKSIIQSVEIYQSHETMTREQAKLRLIRGVDVKVYDGEIVSINIDSKIVPKGTAIRLSDFAPACGKYLFHGMPFYWGSDVLLTVILDDKIKLSNLSLNEGFMKGVGFDIREVHSMKIVDALCKGLVSTSTGLDLIGRGYVKASENILDYMKSICVLNRPNVRGSDIFSIDEVVVDPELATKLITKKYRSEFVSVSKARLIHADGKSPRWHKDIQDFLYWLNINVKNIDTLGYSGLKMSRFGEVFKAVRELSTVNKNVVTRFEHYFRLFLVPDEMKEVYVTFVKSACKWVSFLAVSKGWV